MDEQSRFFVVSTIAIVGLLVVGFMLSDTTPTGYAGKPALTECKDRIDNDGDGYIDYAYDPGCSGVKDKSERNPAVECDNGYDDDLDGRYDWQDTGCLGPTDKDESNCGDKVCEGGETCGTCSTDCGSCAYCGNGVLEIGEECDDGNTRNGDGCDSTCRVEVFYCGNGVCDSTESCHTCWQDCGLCQLSCTDTDGGIQPYVVGTVIFTNGTSVNMTDYCMNNRTVLEYYCQYNQPAAIQMPCNVTMCAGGRCY